MPDTTSQLRFADTDTRRPRRGADQKSVKLRHTQASGPDPKRFRKERENAADPFRRERPQRPAEPSPDARKQHRNQVLETAAIRRKASGGRSAPRSPGGKAAFPDARMPAPNHALRSATHAMAGAVSRGVNQSIRESNADDNSGVASAQFAGAATEGAVCTADHATYRHKLKRYANEERFTAKTDAEHLDRLYRRAAKANPEAASNPFSRWRQRQEIKRQYTAAKSGRAAAQTGVTVGKRTADALQTMGSNLLLYAKSHSHILIVLSCAALLLMVIAGGVSSCTAVLSGVGNAAIVTSFTAEDADILGADEDYTAKEDALRRQIQEMQQGNYDEYRLNLDTVGHSPWELTALLTVLEEDYTRQEVQSLLQRIFDLQYSLSTHVTTETVTDTKTVEVGESLGIVTTSAYCSCRICCGQWSGGPTASGVYPRANHTIAVDARNPFVPMGTKVIMNGIEYTVEDTGNFDRYGVQFDVYYDSHQAALVHGHKQWECYLAGGGNSIEVTTTKTKSICTITLVNHTLRNVVDQMHLTADQKERFLLLLETKGNRPDLFPEEMNTGR